MTLTILYFAATRDLAGTPEEKLEVPEGVRTIAALRDFLMSHRETLRGRLDQVRIARNERFAEDGEGIAEGDVIALIPPVAGG